MNEIDRYLSIAQSAVDLAATHVQTRRPAEIASKGDRDLVTDTDLDIERRLRGLLAAATPGIPLLGEEEGGASPDAPVMWVLDPVDGTSNYARDLPLVGVSLALVRDNEPVLGVVALPLLGRRYWAALGRGAHRDGLAVASARTSRVDEAIIAIGDYGTGPNSQSRNAAALALHAHLAPRAHRVRMLGSAAVDLAWIADGTLDASITLGNRPWDTAAGVVIAREAGARVVDLDGSDHTTRSRCTIAAAPGLCDQIVDAVQRAAQQGRFTPPAAVPSC